MRTWTCIVFSLVEMARVEWQLGHLSLLFACRCDGQQISTQQKTWTQKFETHVCSARLFDRDFCCRREMYGEYNSVLSSNDSVRNNEGEKRLVFFFVRVVRGILFPASPQTSVCNWLFSHNRQNKKPHQSCGWMSCGLSRQMACGMSSKICRLTPQIKSFDHLWRVPQYLANVPQTVLFFLKS